MKKFVKQFLSVMLSAVIILSVVPALSAEEVPYAALFSWNFTQKTKYATPKISGTSATAVSWGDYRAAFMVFELPEESDKNKKWAISDSYLVFDNGQKEGQAPDVTIKTVDGDALMELYEAGLPTSSDETVQKKLEEIRDSGVTVGIFSTLSSSVSSPMYLDTYIENAKAENKKYIGFYLTCRSEDNAKNAGIVNFVKPVLTEAMETEAVDEFDVSVESVGIKVGKSESVTPKISPDNAEIKSVTSSDESVVSVKVNDGKILIEGLKAGFADIAIEVWYGEKKMQKSFCVTVSENANVVESKAVSLIKNGTAAAVLMDGEYANDTRAYKQIRRAVNDLRQDLGMVSGAMNQDDIPMADTTEKQEERLSGIAPIITEIPSAAENAIIVGSIESSP
ncbi:MAG: Ig-like domain-containing protein, partial [Clostridia bacterium]